MRKKVTSKTEEERRDDVDNQLVALIKFAVPPTLSLPFGLFYHIRPIPASQSSSPVRYVAPIIDEVLVTTELPPVQIGGPILGLKSASVTDVPKMIPCHTPLLRRPVLSGTAWLMLLQLAGGLFILALVINQKLRLKSLSEGAAPATDPDLCIAYEDLCTALRLRHPPRLLVSNRNHAPMTFGTWKPAIVMPVDLVRELPIHELRVILGHELAHHRRRDMWLGWLTHTYPEG